MYEKLVIVMRWVQHLHRSSRKVGKMRNVKDEINSIAPGDMVGFNEQ